MKTKYAIIENEPISLESLKQTVAVLRPEYELVFTAESVEESIAFFQESPGVDLVFMDIELVDGNCFEIFGKVEVHTPIIFTTAYDTFALQAFKVNSVDYLLKLSTKPTLSVPCRSTSAAGKPERKPPARLRSTAGLHRRPRSTASSPSAATAIRS
ncbi:LytR/AlgR family response regulator transcription factor [Prevotella dentasini]|uniref:LytR/AlgR family response regulator transcription factor n=1 Tax=Prevotella dentasini TaxID=589537 RepID=UPI0006883000|nr:response regulator [Prevotella dentasini]